MTKPPPCFKPAELHDDTLIGATKAAQFLGLADSSFYLLRQRMGADFPKPTLIIGRPRYRVGALREWLRRMEAQNGEELTKPYREHPVEAQP